MSFYINLLKIDMFGDHKLCLNIHNCYTLMMILTVIRYSLVSPLIGIEPRSTMLQMKAILEKCIFISVHLRIMKQDEYH